MVKAIKSLEDKNRNGGSWPFDIISMEIQSKLGCVSKHVFIMLKTEYFFKFE